jgi:hypothetical protein
VAVSGSTAVVGAFGESTWSSSGAAYVFNATTGAVIAYLYNPTPAAGDQFGYSVAVSGNTAVVGAIGDDTQNANQGAAYVLTANDAPTDISLSPSTVAENLPAGTTVGTVTTTDPDTSSPPTYALVSGEGSTDNASFTIVGNQLRTAAVFDYEAQSSYSIRVRTTDAGGLSFEKVLTVTVTNIDEARIVTGDFGWAVGAGSAGGDEGRAVATDAAGNVYVTGYFSGTVDFDPSAADAALTAAGGQDVFVAKYTAAGALVWVRQLGGQFSTAATGIAVDSSGNVYTTGSFAGTVDFDPGAGTANLTAAGKSDVFVLKLDAGGN